MFKLFNSFKEKLLSGKINLFDWQPSHKVTIKVKLVIKKVHASHLEIILISAKDETQIGYYDVPYFFDLDQITLKELFLWDVEIK